MAGTKKTTKKSTSSKKNNTANKKTEVKKESGFGLEITLLVILALSIILLLSNFGVGGVVGNAISSFFFGLFGIPSYIFPILLFLGIAFGISNANNRLAYKKMIGGVLFFLFATALMQLLTEGYVSDSTLVDYYKASSEYKTGGGIVGGMICNGCSTAFGVLGAYVIIIFGIIISLVLVTQKSFFGFVKKGSTRAYSKAKETHIQRRESAPKEERRRNKKASGVPIDTVIAAPKEETDSKEETVDKKEKPAAVEVFGTTEENRRDELLNEDLDDEIPIIRFEPEEAEPVTVEKEVPKEEVKKKRKSPSSMEEIQSGIEDIKEEMASQNVEEKKEYQFPPLHLLAKGDSSAKGDSDAHLRETAHKLQETLHNFGVNVTITNVSCGPTVTRYELQPEQGVKVSKIVNLTDDIKLNLAATDIRMEAPIPGKAAIGIEVPNAKTSSVALRDLLGSSSFEKFNSNLAFAVGKDISGQPVIADIAKMPHLLIAGATGSGKSVCINTLIMSLIYKASPDDVKLIMIDPKVVELSVYNGIPHLFIPVVTDPKKAAGALNWAVAEMTERYNKFAEYGVRDLKGYNAKVAAIEDIEDETKPQKMPQIVIIVDELADLMMVAPGEVEDAICRLAQLARAAGIHLIIATQRPSVDVITGIIKANMPSRIAFSVSSGVDSRTILDMNGAEKLLGKGDMLFYPQGYTKPVRMQGAFISDEEVEAVVKFLTDNNAAVNYDSNIEEKIKQVQAVSAGGDGGHSSDRDAYFIDAGKFIIEKDKASIGMLQRVFKIGFNRAARIMDQLCEAGVVGEEEGTKPRKVLMSAEQFEQYIEEYL